MMRRSGDADSFVGDNIDILTGGVGEAMARIHAKIHFMMSIRDVEGLRQLSRAGTKPAFIVNAAPFFHSFDSTERLQRANQDEAIACTLHQHVQHPVRAVTEINISRARFVPLDECASAWT
jgi:hypothetical protein